MDELYQATVKKTDYLKRNGYNVVEIWECDIKREMDEEMKHYFEHFPIVEPLEPYGGRTIGPMPRSCTIAAKGTNRSST